jgi:ketol-acid reductoisomerase
MATMFYDKDADISLIRRRKVAVIGYGSQGHAHALNLQGQRRGRGRGSAVVQQVGRQGARRGLKVLSVADARQVGRRHHDAHPDTRQAKVYETRTSSRISPAGKMLMFAHGFNIRFNCIQPARRRT